MCSQSEVFIVEFHCSGQKGGYKRGNQYFMELERLDWRVVLVKHAVCWRHPGY